MDLVEQLNKNPFVLAPMAGVTDFGFRSFMKNMGCGIVISELVSATGVRHGSKKTVDIMKTNSFQSPVGVQLFGDSVEDMSWAAKFVEDQGADFVDINFGCPVKKVVKRGAGAAAMKDLASMKNLLREIKKSISIPLTIKIRTGWDENSRNANEVCEIAYNEGITWVAIHGRTRAQGYSGKSDWEFIENIKKETKIPIIGNGDIQTPKEAVERISKSNCDGVMIGRGCLRNPWIFDQAMKLMTKKEGANKFSGIIELGEGLKTQPNYAEMFALLEKSLCNWTVEKRALIQLKKLTAWMSAGFPDSAKYRKLVFQVESVNQLSNLFVNYFGNIDSFSFLMDSTEQMIMGGHG